MAVLTAAQIKTILLTGVYPETIEINAALMQNEERRKYPSIDVQNITGQEDTKDFPTTTTGQTFLVHLFYRYRSFGEQHEPDIKLIEDVIFNTLDAASDLDVLTTKISVTQSWRRTSETFPVHRSHSILTVRSEEISSTDSTGIPGDEISITFPAPLGLLKVISLVSDERELTKQQDLSDDSEEIFTKIHFAGLIAAEVELNTTQESQLDTQIAAGVDISVTLTKSGTPVIVTANLINRISSATRQTVQSSIVTMDVK